VIYSGVKNYNAMSRLVRFEKQKYFLKNKKTLKPTTTVML
jgi:hypothetical protein